MKVHRKDTGVVVVELETIQEILVIFNVMESLEDTVYVKPAEGGVSAARAFLNNNRESVEQIGSCLWSGLSDILKENAGRG